MIHIDEEELKLIHLGDDEEGEDEKEQKAPKTPAVAMDLLKKERTIIISEEVSPKLTQRVMSSLLWLDSQSDDPIKLYINTPGGSADDGFAIFDLIRFVKAPVKLRHRANEVFAEECGRTVKQVEKDTDRDYWMSPEEAIEYGLVGRIITNLNDITK